MRTHTNTVEPSSHIEVSLHMVQGQLVLNSNTEVKGISDRGKKRCLFEVTCGHTGVAFEISADDQRSKHEWILAIKKVHIQQYTRDIRTCSPVSQCDIGR